MSALICHECRTGACRECEWVALVEDDRYVLCRCGCGVAG